MLEGKRKNNGNLIARRFGHNFPKYRKLGKGTVRRSEGLPPAVDWTTRFCRFNRTPQVGYSSIPCIGNSRILARMNHQFRTTWLTVDDLRARNLVACEGSEGALLLVGNAQAYGRLHRAHAQCSRFLTDSRFTTPYARALGYAPSDPTMSANALRPFYEAIPNRIMQATPF